MRPGERLKALQGLPSVFTLPKKRQGTRRTHFILARQKKFWPGANDQLALAFGQVHRPLPLPLPPVPAGNALHSKAHVHLYSLCQTWLNLKYTLNQQAYDSRQKISANSVCVLGTERERERERERECETRGTVKKSAIM